MIFFVLPTEIGIIFFTFIINFHFLKFNLKIKKKNQSLTMDWNRKSPTTWPIRAKTSPRRRDCPSGAGPTRRGGDGRPTHSTGVVVFACFPLGRLKFISFLNFKNFKQCFFFPIVYPFLNLIKYL
jgi:hypothetical protein